MKITLTGRRAITYAGDLIRLGPIGAIRGSFFSCEIVPRLLTRWRIGLINYWLAICFFCFCCSITAADDNVLCAGFGECDVSPVIGNDKIVYVAGYGHGRKATGLHDPIMARAVVLENGKQKIALACVDVVGLFYSTAENVRKELPDFAYVLVSSTHNHEGPDTLGLWGSNPFSSGLDPDYMKSLEAGIVKAIKQAKVNLAPVTARIGSVKAPQLLHDGRLPIVLHDDLVVIEFTHATTMKRHGILMQWNCHPEALGPKNTQISADFVAAAVKDLQLSHACPVAYFTGTVGGLLSPSGVKVHGSDGTLLKDGTFERTEGYGVLVAREAQKALKGANRPCLHPLISACAPSTCRLTTDFISSLGVSGFSNGRYMFGEAPPFR